MSEDIKVVSTVVDEASKHVGKLFQLLDDSQKDKLTREELKEEIENLREVILDAVKTSTRKGNLPLSTAIEINNSNINNLNERLQETSDYMRETFISKVSEMNDQLEELREERQRVAELEKKIEEWKSTAVKFFDYLQRTLTTIPPGLGDVERDDNHLTETVSKILKDFESYVGQHGLQKVSPERGDDFVDGIHQVCDQKESSEIEVGKIISCEEWGYTFDGKRFEDRFARVITNKIKKTNDGASNPKSPDEQQAEKKPMQGNYEAEGS